MSNESDYSAELGLFGDIAQTVVGFDPPDHPQLDAHRQEELQAFNQQLAAEHQGETTEESDGAGNVTSNNSPVASDHEQDDNRPITPTAPAQSSRYNMRPSTRSGSARKLSHAPPPDEEDRDNGDDFDTDAHTGDEDEVLTAPTITNAQKTATEVVSDQERMESTADDLELAHMLKKSWKSQTQVLNYRDQLVTEIRHYANMMDRFMDIYESPEPFRPDEDSDPVAVHIVGRKAFRRIQRQRTELQECQQHIEDIKRKWFLWIAHIPVTFKPDEIKAREDFLDIQGDEIFAITWRRHGAHLNRLDEEEEEVKAAIEWAQEEMAHRRRLKESQYAHTTPRVETPTGETAIDGSIEPPARVIRMATHATSSGPTTTAMPTAVVTGAAAPATTAAYSTTSATASTWSTTQTSVPTFTTKPTAQPPTQTASSSRGFNVLTAEQYQAQKAALGLQAVTRVNALHPRPADTFVAGTSSLFGTSSAAVTQTSGFNSTALRKPTDQSRADKQPQQLRFATQKEVIEITPNKKTDTRTNTAKAKPTAQKIPVTQPAAQTTAPTSSGNGQQSQPPPTELSTVVDALKMVMTRMTGLEDEFKKLSSQAATLPQAPAASATQAQARGTLNVTADGRTLSQSANTAMSHRPDHTGQQRERANGDYVIPLPSAADARATPTPTAATPATRMMAAYGMAAKTGEDFGDGIRVSPMDGRSLNPEVAVNSPVGPKPPTFQRTLPSGTTLPAAGTGHTPTTRAHSQSSTRAPEPKPFFGEYHDWPRFSSEWTYFVNSTMPDQYSLMTLLKKLLKGSAQTTAQRYDGYASEDYDDLWQALCSRFHKPELVIQHYLGIFKEIHAPTRETIQDLRQFHGETCVAVNKLKRANRDVNNEMFTHTLDSKIQTPKLVAHLHQRKQEASRSGAEWHTTAILNAMEEFIQEMEELDARVKQFSTPRNRPFRPQRTFYSQDGRKVRVRCDEDELEWADDDQDDPSSEPPTLTRDHSPQNQTPRASRNRSPQKQNVHVTFGEHQKKQFGKRSTPASFAPVERARIRKPRKGPNGQTIRARCLFCDSTKHVSRDCKKYKTHTSRIKRLEAVCRCVYCVHVGHTMDACHLRKKHMAIREAAKDVGCVYCQDLHNLLVCPQKFPQEERPKSPPPPARSKSEKSTLVAHRDSKESAHTNSSPESTDDESFDIGDTFTDYGTPDDSTDDDEAPPQRRQHNFNAVAHSHPKEPVSAQTLLMTTHIPVINTAAHKVEEAVPVFFDQGSDQTYITKSLAERLGLTINQRYNSIIHTFMDREPDGRPVEVWEVEFDLRLLDGSTIHITADAVDDFAAPMPTVNGRTKAVAHIIVNPELPVPIVCETPQILIGTDFLNEFDVIRRRKPLSNGFYVYDSLVGPMLNGKGAATGGFKGPHVHNAHKIYKAHKGSPDLTALSKTPTASGNPDQPTNEALMAALNSLSSLEALGIQSSETIDDSAEVLAKHRETLRRSPDGRYETGLPWLSFVNEMLSSPQKKARVLPTNYKPALARLNISPT